MAIAPSSFEHGDEPDGAAARVEALFQAHGRLVLGICHGMLRDREEAEDASQQTFLSAYRSLLGGVAPRDEGAWIATIARNECRARIALRMRRGVAAGNVELLADEAAPAVPGLDPTALRAAIGALPDMQRRAFVLRELRGYSYGEVADALAVSEPAVDSLLVRARRTLKTKLRAASAAAYGFGPVMALRDVIARGASAVGGVSSLPEGVKAAAGVAVVAIAAGGTTVAAVTVSDSERRRPAPSELQAGTGIGEPPAGAPGEPSGRSQPSPGPASIGARADGSGGASILASSPSGGGSSDRSPTPGGALDGEGSGQRSPPPGGSSGSSAPAGPGAAGGPAGDDAGGDERGDSNDDAGSSGAGPGEDDEEEADEEEGSSGPGSDADDEEERDEEDSSGPGSAADDEEESDEDDSSGPGSGEDEEEADEEDSSGPGSGEEDDEEPEEEEEPEEQEEDEPDLDDDSSGSGPGEEPVD